MVTSSLAHAGWFHLLGNLIFFLAFAPALESLLGSKIRYIWIMLFISFVVGLSYSISTVIGSSRPLPSLGFSGVVMGMIGLSAWLMPHARIRVFFWGIVFWKTFYIPAWIVAAFYIGLDSWEMMTARDYGSINVVAHVAGGFAGYLYGYIWLKERKLEVREELSDEIKRMKSERNPISPHSRVIAYGKKNPSNQLAPEPVALAPHQQQRENEKNHDQFMGRVYQAVMTHRDSEAILLLLQKH
ncbi:MAG: rhomboid family intramembrane serine protease, partial [bacterium]|nr:rhomboid family intramembrane serine protease [bacterium]